MGGTFIELGGELEMFRKFLGGALQGKIPFRSGICRENGNHKIEGIHWHSVMKFPEQFSSCEQVKKGFVSWDWFRN
jgi:hypothetical protein